MSKSIFLSYARSDDEPFVAHRHADLTARGFDVWWDRVSMPARGLTFLYEIRDAIDAVVSVRYFRLLASICCISFLTSCGTFYAKLVECAHPARGTPSAISQGPVVVRETGYGPRKVVLIHGNPGFLGNVEPLARELALQGYHVLSYDRPGHGHSEEIFDSTIDKQLRGLHELMRARDFLPAEDGGPLTNRPFLVGHSFGGALALLYAHKYSNDVGGLVFFGTEAFPDPKLPFGFPPSVYGNCFFGMLADLTIGVPVAIPYAHLAIKNAFLPQQVTGAGGYARCESLSLFTRPAAARAMVRDEKQMFEALSKLWISRPQFHVPVVIVTGNDDHLVDPLRHSLPLRFKLRDSSRLFVIQSVGMVRGIGHMIPQLFPTEGAKTVAYAFEWGQKGKGSPPDPSNFGLPDADAIEAIRWK